jgi:phage terminase large subunit-like protein
MKNSTELSRQDKIAYLELVAEKERRVKEDPLKYAIQHDKQKEATASMAAIRVLFWANRVGKTEWGGQETSRYATANHPFRNIREGVEIWACCPSYEVQEDTTQKKLLAYLPEKDIARIDYLRGKIIKKITMKNGTGIVFKSYDQGREKFQGTGKRLIWFDEEPPRDIWEECFVRVEAGQQLDVIMTMTPVKGMTWVYDEIYLATNNPDLFVSNAGWDDNPFLTAIQKEQMSRGLSQYALQVRREGKFVKRVGLVCAWWDRSKHVRHYDSLNRSWTWYEVLDGGWSDPAAWLLVGVDNDNNVHVVNGYREPQLEAKRIKEMRDAKINGLTITRGWTDTDDPRLQLELQKEHMILESVEKKPGETQSWDDTLARKLEEYGKVQPGTGQPRLFISDNLVRMNEKTGKEENWLVQEIENLVWLERITKQGEEIQPKWDDHRRFGHHFDGIRALSYLLVSYMKPAKVDAQPHIPDWIQQKANNRGGIL